jgi:hypothetical protein
MVPPVGGFALTFVPVYFIHPKHLAPFAREAIMHLSIVFVLAWMLPAPDKNAKIDMPITVTLTGAVFPEMLLKGWELPHVASRDVANQMFPVGSYPIAVANQHLLCFRRESSESYWDDDHMNGVRRLKIRLSPHRAVKHNSILISTRPTTAFGIWNSGRMVIEFVERSDGPLQPIVWIRDVLEMGCFLPHPQPLPPVENMPNLPRWTIDCGRER